MTGSRSKTKTKQNGPEITLNESRSAPCRHNPFAHAGTPDWGKGGRYIIDQNGVRRPQTQKEA